MREKSLWGRRTGGKTGATPAKQRDCVAADGKGNEPLSRSGSSGVVRRLGSDRKEGLRLLSTHVLIAVPGNVTC